MDREVPELCVEAAGGKSSSWEMYQKKSGAIQLEERLGDHESTGASGGAPLPSGLTVPQKSPGLAGPSALYGCSPVKGGLTRAFATWC